MVTPSSRLLQTCATSRISSIGQGCVARVSAHYCCHDKSHLNPSNLSINHSISEYMFFKYARYILFDSRDLLDFRKCIGRWNFEANQAVAGAPQFHCGALFCGGGPFRRSRFGAGQLCAVSYSFLFVKLWRKNNEAGNFLNAVERGAESAAPRRSRSWKADPWITVNQMCKHSYSSTEPNQLSVQKR